MLGALEPAERSGMRFEDRLGMLLQHELADRENARFSQHCQPATAGKDLDTHIPTRHLDPMLSTVRDLGWIGRHLNVLITGIGKSFIGAALAHAACRMNYHVRCFRLPRLIDELARAHAFQRRDVLAFTRQSRLASDR
jgi:DNA replication protein DnaC